MWAARDAHHSATHLWAAKGAAHGPGGSKAELRAAIIKKFCIYSREHPQSNESRICAATDADDGRLRDRPSWGGEFRTLKSSKLSWCYRLRISASG